MPANLIHELDLLLSRTQQPTEHEVRVALLRWVTDYRRGTPEAGTGATDGTDGPGFARPAQG